MILGMPSPLLVPTPFLLVIPASQHSGVLCDLLQRNDILAYAS
jgi:hypothetical protein